MKLTPLLVCTLILLSFNGLFAQGFTPDPVSESKTSFNSNSYTKAIGVKVSPGAITYKSFFKQNKAIEAIGYITLDGFSVSVLKEFYTPIEGAESLSWYYGYGGHLGIWSEEWKRTNSGTSNSNIAVGVDGIIGLDYKIKNTPLNLSIDWQPAFSIIQSYFKNHGGISIRYILK